MLTGKELTVDPPPPPKVGRLDSLRDVRRELAKVYKDARQGRIPTIDASRLAFVLTTIARVIEQSDIERRVEALEKGLKGKYVND